MSFRVGIVGVSGYGGGEALRICAGHPEFQVVYVAGESSAGAKLSDRFPGIIPKLSATPGAIRTPAPKLGEHTEEVLRGIGYSDADIARLRASKIV